MRFGPWLSRTGLQQPVQLASWVREDRTPKVPRALCPGAGGREAVPFWSERMRPFTLQPRKMPFLVMARRRGRRCSVTHAQPRLVGTLTAFPLHLNNTFTRYAPPPGVCPHASRPGSRLMLSPFPSCCPWWCKAGGAGTSIRAQPGLPASGAVRCPHPPPPLSRTHLLSLPSYEHSRCTGRASLYLGRTLRRNNRKVGNVRAGAPPGRRRHSRPCRPSPAQHCASSRVSGGQLSRMLHEQLTPSRNSKWQFPCQEAAAVFQQTGSPQLCSPPIQARQTAHPAGCRL